MAKKKEVSYKTWRNIALKFFSAYVLFFLLIHIAGIFIKSYAFLYGTNYPFDQQIRGLLFLIWPSLGIYGIWKNKLWGWRAAYFYWIIAIIGNGFQLGKSFSVPVIIVTIIHFSALMISYMGMRKLFPKK